MSSTRLEAVSYLDECQAKSKVEISCVYSQNSRHQFHSKSEVVHLIDIFAVQAQGRNRSERIKRVFRLIRANYGTIRPVTGF
jgi:hypothetical protein